MFKLSELYYLIDQIEKVNQLIMTVKWQAYFLQMTMSMSHCLCLG